jgi:Fe2+ or Zn2+ uptake regulation protein
MASPVDVTHRLRAAGLRVTGPRPAVPDVLARHPHSTADVVAGLVRREHRSVFTQAVYDVLAACTEAALVGRIEPAGSPARFETRTGDNHHLVCRSCGDTTNVDRVVGTRPCLAPGGAAGYLVGAAEIMFWGTCPRSRHPNQHQKETP